jgi:acyl-CoA dehydrogenase/citronellyl-CoA dehydrogenase
MLFELDEEHESFRKTCRTFVGKVVLPERDTAEQDGFPHSLWSQLAAAGLLGIGHPEEDGGTGGDYLAMAILAEELAKVSGGIAVTILVSSYMAAPHLGRFASGALRERYLRPVLRGEAVAAIAVTEPSGGSDVAGLTTSAKAVDGGYVLNGAKTFITNAGLADFVIVAARTGGPGHDGITMFCVEPGSDGLEMSTALKKLGWHASDTRELSFQDCFVPADHIVGEIGAGFRQIMVGFQGERIALSAMGVGLAQAAFDEARVWARNRQAFGATIGSFQAIRHRLGEMETAVAAARLMTYQAASRLDHDHADAAKAVAMAKLYTARTANMVADAAVQIFGGLGFMAESAAALHYRDARVLRIGGGTDEIQLQILAKAMDL